MSMKNCARCGATFRESRGTFSEEGLICGDCSDVQADLEVDLDLTRNQGSVPLGFLAGFFGGCIGLVLVLVIAKGGDTKKGAGFGFAAQLVVGGALRILAQAV